VTSAADGRFRPVDHYENFPVASWLCPPRLRPAVAAIYWFARTADDIADEGEAPPEQRLADLALFGSDLDACAAQKPDSGNWPQVFNPLRAAMQAFALPRQPLADLLAAFTQDVVKTRDGLGYANRAELAAYCRLSANPIGRLMLHLYGVRDAAAFVQSDQICTALQLANFWQDVSRDVPRGRYYLLPGETMPDLVAWARSLMLQGAPLVHRLPGRAGWELRLVVQGGLRILQKIGRQGFDTRDHRPRLTAWDGPVLLWRALRM
jgi:phytoene/squalene synthetase